MTSSEFTALIFPCTFFFNGNENSFTQSNGDKKSVEYIQRV